MKTEAEEVAAYEKRCHGADGSIAPIFWVVQKIHLSMHIYIYMYRYTYIYIHIISPSGHLDFIGYLDKNLDMFMRNLVDEPPEPPGRLSFKLVYVLLVADFAVSGIIIAVDGR